MERTNYNIAVIPGDGIGKEVVPESLRVLEAVAKKYNFTFDISVLRISIFFNT